MIDENAVIYKLNAMCWAAARFVITLNYTTIMIWFCIKQSFLMLEPTQYSINIAGAGLEKVSIFVNATDNMFFWRQFSDLPL